MANNMGEWDKEHCVQTGNLRGNKNMCRTSHKISTNLKQREGDLEDKGNWHKKIGAKRSAELQQKNLAQQQQKISSWWVADKGERANDEQQKKSKWGAAAEKGAGKQQKNRG
jgi:hypothetical protein